MAIKIFTGTKKDVLEKEINDFMLAHKVFATQHSTAVTSGDPYDVVYTLVVFYHPDV